MPSHLFPVTPEPRILEEKGMAVRIVHNKKRDVYRVEASPLKSNGEIAGQWGVFGGSVGYTSSVYGTEEEARKTLEKIQEMDNDELLDYFAIGENQ